MFMMLMIKMRISLARAYSPEITLWFNSLFCLPVTDLRSCYVSHLLMPPPLLWPLFESVIELPWRYAKCFFQTKFHCLDWKMWFCISCSFSMSQFKFVVDKQIYCWFLCLPGLIRSSTSSLFKLMRKTCTIQKMLLYPSGLLPWWFFYDFHRFFTYIN